ncbi:hypothetical protein GCM10022393_42720 [Aquimarina addita]|uniref:Uncharacterized protein n=1 Tax=Aquimarina addita TaxID=870485 RepID=A0ABP6UZG5_9FLAO
MKNIDIIDKNISRLNKIRSTKETLGSNSNILLFKEFLRRLSYVYKLSKIKSDFELNFYLSEINDDDNFLENITNFIDSKYYKKLGNGGYFLFHSFLIWEIFKNRLKSLSNLNEEYLEVYEPLIRIFERGGYINKEGSVYNVCDLKGFKINQDYLSNIPFILDFSDENLDKIDALGK